MSHSLAACLGEEGKRANQEDKWEPHILTHNESSCLPNQTCPDGCIPFFNPLWVPGYKTERVETGILPDNIINGVCPSTVTVPKTWDNRLEKTKGCLWLRFRRLSP